MKYGFYGISGNESYGNTYHYNITMVIPSGNEWDIGNMECEWENGHFMIYTLW